MDSAARHDANAYSAVLQKVRALVSVCRLPRVRDADRSDDGPRPSDRRPGCCNGADSTRRTPVCAWRSLGNPAPWERDDLPTQLAPSHAGRPLLLLPPGPQSQPVRGHRLKPISRLDQLGARRCAVALHLADGLTDGGIADRLGISTGTVRKHIYLLGKQLGVRDDRVARIVIVRWVLEQRAA